jgi:hypothetical protein
MWYACNVSMENKDGPTRKMKKVVQAREAII